MQASLPSNGLLAGQIHYLTAGSYSFPLGQSVHFLVVELKKRGGGQAMQSVGETWKGVASLHSQFPVCLL